MARIDAFLEMGRQQGASDIHFAVHRPPLLRLDGELDAIHYRDLSAEECESLIREIVNDERWEQITARGAADFSYDAGPLGRYRINVCRHRNGLSAICRIIPNDVPSPADLGLPRVLSQFGQLAHGLVLVTGPTGTGKSTTIAAMLREINERDSLHILTLEDPIEFLHESQRCQVVQREVGTHVRSFQDGLRAALREDPDVILVGELRDPETVTLALEAAETGHLVLGTLHTRGAASTIERLVDAHPSENHAQVRHALAENLKAVVSQELIRCADGRGRRAAHEILIVNVAIQQMIREGKSFQINGAITTGKRVGMQLMDQSLLALVRAGEIDPDEAFLKADDKWGFAPFLTRPELLGMVNGEFRAAS
ncbi:MAG: PilT/PilU family type 4a pilus ATPase [Candidatus Eisenbacteria bacterium]